jgi:hypothetical protein
MAQISAQHEDRIATSRKRQNKAVPFLIRDDGMLYPNVPLVAKNPRFRPYHGDIRASLEDRMRYLKGLASRRALVYDEAVAEEPFDLAKATAAEICDFAVEQYGATLDPGKDIKELRSECLQLSQLPPVVMQQPEPPLPDPQPEPPPAPRRRREPATS